MNRIDRLFAITLTLQTEPRVRAKDLAAKFEVTERTIYRDMNALSELGIPVVALPGEGYELAEGFSLPPVILSVDEATALLLAGRMFMQHATGTINYNTELALRKVRAALPEDTRDAAEDEADMIHFYPPDEQMDYEEPYLAQVRQAILQKQVLRMRYYSRKDEITERDVEPAQLSFNRGAWYLTAFCRLRNDEREFRLNRVQSLLTLDEPFTPRIIMPEPSDLLTVSIRFEERVIRWVEEDQHYSLLYESYDVHGNRVFIYEVDELREIRSWILGWGASAEVLSPLFLREQIRAEAEALIQKLT